MAAADTLPPPAAPMPPSAIHLDPQNFRVLGSQLGADEFVLDNSAIDGVMGINMKKLFSIDTDALQLLFHTIIRSLHLQSQAVAQVKAESEARFERMQATIDSQQREIAELRDSTFDLAAARAELQENLDAQKEALGALQTLVDDRASESREALEGLRSRVDEAEQGLATMQEQHALLAQQVDGIEEKVIAQTPGPLSVQSPATGGRAPSATSSAGSEGAASRLAGPSAAGPARLWADARLQARIDWLTESVMRLGGALRALATAPPGAEARDVITDNLLPLPPPAEGPSSGAGSRRPSVAAGSVPGSPARKASAASAAAAEEEGSLHGGAGFGALMANRNLEARLEAARAAREEELRSLHETVRIEFESRLAGELEALEKRVGEALRAEVRGIQSLLDRKAAAEEFSRLSVVLNEFGKNLQAAVEEYRETGRVSAEGLADAAARLEAAEGRLSELEEAARGADEARASDRAGAVRVAAQVADLAARLAALTDSKAEWNEVVALVNRQAAVQQAEKADKAFVQAALRKVVLKLDAAAVVLGDVKAELREHDACLARLLEQDGAAAARMHFRCLSCDKYQPRGSEHADKMPQLAAFPASPQRNPNLVASRDASPPPSRERPAVPSIDLGLVGRAGGGGGGAQSQRSPQPPASTRIKPSMLRPLYSPTLRALVEEGSLGLGARPKEERDWNPEAERAEDEGAFREALDGLAGHGPHPRPRPAWAGASRCASRPSPAAAPPPPAPPAATRAPPARPRPAPPLHPPPRDVTTPAGFGMRGRDEQDSRGSARTGGGAGVSLSVTSSSAGASGRVLSLAGASPPSTRGGPGTGPLAEEAAVD
eukprot:tig00021038_g17539.t1